MMPKLLFTGALVCLSSAAQDVSSRVFPPLCNLHRLENTPVLSFQQRMCLWADRSLFGRETVLGAATSALASQITESAAVRRKGLKGYGERFGTRYAQSTAKGFGEVLGGYLNHEGMRRELGPWRTPAKGGLGRRILHAAVAPLWNYEDDDAHSQYRGKRFAFSRVAGALASGFVGMAWSPDPVNTPSRALRRSASAYGGYFMSSFRTEFGGDVMKLFKKLL